jgi:hypothetical protein
VSDDDFYADPTIFDRCQRIAAGCFSARFVRIRRYAWVVALFVAAAVLLATATWLLLFSVWTRIGSEPTSSWNASFAQWLAVWLALLTAHQLLQYTARAWPMDAAVPGRVAMIFGWIGTLPARPGGDAALERTTADLVVSRVDADDSESKRFLLALRALGVSVGVAKSLSAAGIRCTRQLRGMPDVDLLRIRGVGPATLRRLRMIASRNS